MPHWIFQLFVFNISHSLLSSLVRVVKLCTICFILFEDLVENIWTFWKENSSDVVKVCVVHKSYEVNSLMWKQYAILIQYFSCASNIYVLQSGYWWVRIGQKSLNILKLLLNQNIFQIYNFKMSTMSICRNWIWENPNWIWYCWFFFKSGISIFWLLKYIITLFS